MNRLFTLLFLLLFMVSCKNENTEEKYKEKNAINKNTEAESFDDFVVLFFYDKNFQINRIKFPIMGKILNQRIPEGTIGASRDTIQWTEKNWYFSDPYEVFYEPYVHEKTIIKPDSIQYRIYIPNSGFQDSYKFKLIDGKWFLVENYTFNI